jgi:hypothetical protein
VRLVLENVIDLSVSVAMYHQGAYFMETFQSPTAMYQEKPRVWVMPQLLLDSGKTIDMPFAWHSQSCTVRLPGETIIPVPKNLVVPRTQKQCPIVGFVAPRSVKSKNLPGCMLNGGGCISSNLTSHAKVGRPNLIMNHVRLMRFHQVRGW